MNRLSVLAFWVAAVVALAISAIAYFRYEAVVLALQERVKAEERTITTDKKRIARLNASSAVAAMTLRDLQSVVRDNTSICGNPSDVKNTINEIDRALEKKASVKAQGFLNLVVNLCQNAKPQGEAEERFLLPYGEAIIARIRDQLEEAATMYDAAIRTPGFDKIDAEWRMRAYEGLAYAKMSQGDYRAAAVAVREALGVTNEYGDHVGHDYVFARLTEIKLMCRTRMAPDTVRRKFVQLRSDLEAVAHRTTGLRREYFLFDRRYTDEDDELFDTCSYAGLRPSSP